MKNKKDNIHSKKSLPQDKSSTDFKLKKIENEGKEEPPRLFKVARRGNPKVANDRREFLKDAAAGVGVFLGLGSILSGCEKDADIEIWTDDENCTCHVVCTCDTVDDDNKATWESEFNGVVCSCDLVCTCNTVSTCGCNTHSGGGGGSYWYPN